MKEKIIQRGRDAQWRVELRSRLNARQRGEIERARGQRSIAASRPSRLLPKPADVSTVRIRVVLPDVLYR